MIRPQYTHRRCPICRKGCDFKQLPNEHDAYGRRLIVCTTCGHKEAAPGQPKPTWRELLEDQAPS